MKKIFVCLANSKKYTERCIAGIELIRGAKGFSIAQNTNQPHWIRPVSTKEHGEVSSELVGHIKLLDIVEIDMVKNIPNGYQSENVLVANDSYRVEGEILLSKQVLDKFISKKHSPLFLNRGKAVPAEYIKDLDHSLIFIKPTNVGFCIAKAANGNLQTRATFFYENTIYDLPITDIDFLIQYSLTPNAFNNQKNIYFTISLGLEFNGWHYKLIAGIICFDSIKH